VRDPIEKTANYARCHITTIPGEERVYSQTTAPARIWNSLSGVGLEGPGQWLLTRTGDKKIGCGSRTERRGVSGTPKRAPNRRGPSRDVAHLPPPPTRSTYRTQSMLRRVQIMGSPDAKTPLRPHRVPRPNITHRTVEERLSGPTQLTTHALSPFVAFQPLQPRIRMSAAGFAPSTVS